MPIFGNEGDWTPPCKGGRGDLKPSAPLLLGYQQRWVNDLSPFKVIEKSRRIGLSWAEASDDALMSASSPEAGGMDAHYIGYNKEMAREFIDDVASWARAYSLAAGEIGEFMFEDGEDKNILAFRIKFASSFDVVALSSRPSNLRGKKGKVIIDEAAFHDDLPGLLKAAMAFLMWGGRVVVISTHDGDDNPFNDLVNDIRAGKRPGSLHRVTLDDALEDGLYERICLTQKRSGNPDPTSRWEWRQSLIDYYKDDADEELLCIPSKGKGVFFTRAMVEACMNPDLPVLTWTCPQGFAELPDLIRQAECKDWCDEHLAPLLEKLPANERSWFGEDFGRTGDLTVLFPLQESKTLRYRVPFVVELSNVPFKQQEQILFFIIDRLPRFTGGAFDARGNGQYIAEVAMQRYGASRIAQVMLTTEWYRDAMPKYKAAIEDRSLEMPKSADIVQDHRAVKVEKGVARVPESGRQKSSDGRQRHGDSAISGAMAWFAKDTLSAGEIEFESTGSYRSVYSEASGF